MAMPKKTLRDLDWKAQFALVRLARYLQSHPDPSTANLSTLLENLPELTFLVPEQRSSLLHDWPGELLQRHFRLQGVINPHIFTDILKRPLLFYVIDAKGQYLAVQEHIRTLEAAVSVHRIFGQHDLLVFAIGRRTNPRLVDFEAYMTRLRLDVLVLEVEEVIRYKNCPVPEIPNTYRSLDETWAVTLDAFATDYVGAKVKPLQPEKRLQDRKYLLGVFWSEEFDLTGRVRAYVAVHFPDVVRKETERQYPTFLVELQSVAPHLVSIFKLKPGQGYDFLLELVCDTYGELDVATDDIIALSPISVVTLTFPIAGTIRESVPTIGESAMSLSRGIASVWLALSPEQREKLQSLRQDDWTLIALKETLDRLFLDEPRVEKRASETEERQICEFAQQFARAVLSEDKNILASIRRQLFIELERKLREVVAHIVGVMYEGNESAAFTKVGATHAPPLAWEDYRTFLDKGIWSAFVIDATLQEEWDEVNSTVQGLGATRNREFHGLTRAIDQRREPLGSLVWSIGRDIADCAFCIRWLNALARSVSPERRGAR